MYVIYNYLCKIIYELYMNIIHIRYLMLILTTNLGYALLFLFLRKKEILITLEVSYFECQIT